MSKINIKTLSSILGVSPSTISRVLNGQAEKYRIAAQTRDRIIEKAEELGYRQNYFAHSLNTGRTFNIGMVFANNIDSFLGAIMEGVESRLRDTEFQMVVATCENTLEFEKVEIERMIYRQVDGIIIYPSAVGPTETYSTDHLSQLLAKGIPVVVVGRKTDLPVPHVLFSDYEAGEKAAEAFLKDGHRSFGVINTPVKCSANQCRQMGFIDTLHKNGIKDSEIIIAGTDDTDFTALKDSDCIWAVNFGLLIKYAAGMNKADIKQDISMRSLGIPEGFYGFPFDCTTIPMPAKEMGNKAASLLLRIIENAKPCEREDIYLEWPPEVKASI
jgi:DNA-binding LacI/PurR family transcriptional regulator